MKNNTVGEYNIHLLYKIAHFKTLLSPLSSLEKKKTKYAFKFLL